MKRPSPKSIRKAFAEHLTVGVDGYEQTVWDILHWVGIDDVLLFLQDYAHVGESVGVHVDYEHMSTHNLEESIKQEAQACVGNEAEEAQRIDDASWRP
jgi:hypothetical protein